MGKIKSQPTFKITIDLFDKYKAKRRSLEEKQQMVDEVKDLFMRNYVVNECLDETIRIVAEDHKLKKKRALSL